MARPRWEWTHRYAVPMFVASLVSVVLAGAGMVGVLAFFNPERVAGADGTDPCLHGEWQLTAYDLRQEGARIVLDDDPPPAEFREDGTGVIDFGDGTAFTGRTELVDGESEILVSGPLEYTYRTDEEGLRFETVSAARMEFLILGAPFAQQDLIFVEEPFQYDCRADQLDVRVETATSELTTTYRRP